MILLAGAIGTDVGAHLAVYNNAGSKCVAVKQWCAPSIECLVRFTIVGVTSSSMITRVQGQAGVMANGPSQVP